MAVSLTQGAITEICRGNCSENLQPVLQVIELKQVQSQQNSTVERYCVVLSDGSFYQQGMLATQKNDLVHSGKLQKGSVLRLTQFLCNVVQNHKIIIIIDLDVILDYCELIGQPVSTPKHTPKEPGVNFGNSQSLNSSSHAGGMNARPNVSGSSIYYPKANPPARNDPPAYPKAKTLTQGAIMEICSGNDPKNLQPVLQVIEFKLVQSQQNSTIERYRVVLSDGSFYQQGMLATQKNELIYSGRLQQGAIIRLTQFICNVVQNRKIIIIVDLDVICEKCELIGEPVAAPKGAPAESATGQSGFTFGNLLLKKFFQQKQAMDFFFKGMNRDGSECPFDVKDIQRCPFLRNINEPTNFSFSSTKISIPVHGSKGPIFEDGPSFGMAFKLFHGKDGVIPLSEKSDFHNGSTEADSLPVFNPLAGRAASISLSGPGGPFSFWNFSEKWKKQKNSESSNKKEYSPQNGDVSKHEALGNEWLAKGTCPIAKSYRAVSNVLPLVATAFRPPSGVKLRCPHAIVAARAALARTTFVKNMRPQPLPAKMLVIAALGMAVNVPFGMWKEHTKKFSLSWFVAVHAAVPFIAMLRKSVVMPKSAMALTIAASILGQVIGSRAERIRLKTIAVEMGKVKTETVCSMESYNSPMQLGDIRANHCGAEGMVLKSSLPVKDTGSTSTAGVCY